MNRTELIPLIKGQMELGKSTDEAVEYLRESGYTDELLPNFVGSIYAEHKRHRRKNAYWYLAVGILFLIAGLATWGSSSTIWHGSYYETTTYYYWGGVVGGAFLVAIGWMKLKDM